jgi:hypothetical protein
MTPRTDPAMAFEAILAADVGAFDAARASQALAEARLVRGVLDGFEAAVTLRLGELHQRGQSAPATDLHTKNGGVSAKEAQRKERRAKALEQAPTVAASLCNGTIGAEHADALANATIRLDDDVQAAFFDRDADLAADAARMTPEAFGKNCRDLVRLLERDAGVERDQRQRRETRLDKKIDRDGMYVLNARMHPELGNAVFNTIDAETAALVKAGGDRSVDRSQVAAEALGNLVVGAHQAKRPGEAEIRVHVDEQTASTGKLHEHSVCEFDDGTPIPPASVLRLLCSGLIIPIIVGADGNVLNVGREHRVANRAQRRALRAMYRTCAFHGCDVAFSRCEIHHIHEWELNGLTDLENLLPLCVRHHHLVHDQRWLLELAADRTLTIRQPDGSVFATTRPDVPGKPAPTLPGQPSPNRRSHPRRQKRQKQLVT